MAETTGSLGDPPYDVMSVEELMEDRQCIEFTLRYAAQDGDQDRIASTIAQIDWYNRAIQWRLQNDD